jgi:pimeloyl-ACP methyl ester carboxylesterase
MSHQNTALGEHTQELVSIHESLLKGSGVTSRYLEPIPGERVHLLEHGQGDPLVMLHGSGPTSLQFLPLIEELSICRVTAVDRPGFGLSDPHQWPTDRRGAAVEWIDALLDALELRTASLLGSSSGGTWAIWYALARPSRVDQLILIGAPPTLSVNTPPPPLRMVASIDPANPPSMPPPSRESVVQNMSGMGEADTIIRYPEQIDAMVAAGRDPLSGRTSLDELRALISTDGWQPGVETSIDSLRNLQPPTLLIWGENDPLGGREGAQRTTDAIPQSRLELLDAGHGPWLGHTARVAELITQFVEQGRT